MFCLPLSTTVGFPATHYPTSSLSSSTSMICFPAKQLACGYALNSLSLVNCPNLSLDTLNNIAQNCPRLREVTFKGVDDMFKKAKCIEEASIIAEDTVVDALTSFAQCCRSLHTLHLSLNVPDLHSEAFRAFAFHPSLRTLHVSSSRHITNCHLLPFTTLHKLVISGCPALGDELPFRNATELREVSYLGKGLSVNCIWRLWLAASQLKSLGIDSPGQSFEATSSHIGSPVPPPCGDDSTTSLPDVLLPYAQSNILSSTLPSWALAYLLVLSPASLHSFSLHGTFLESPSTFGPNFHCGPYDAENMDGYISEFGYPYRYGHNTRMSVLRRPKWWRWALDLVYSVKPSSIHHHIDGNRSGRWPVLPLPATMGTMSAAMTCPAHSQAHPLDQVVLSLAHRDKFPGSVAAALPSSPSSLAASPASASSCAQHQIANDDTGKAAAFKSNQDLIDLLSLYAPTKADGKGAVGDGRLTREQRCWLHQVTGSRFVRLEV